MRRFCRISARSIHLPCPPCDILEAMLLLCVFCNSAKVTEDHRKGTIILQFWAIIGTIVQHPNNDVIYHWRAPRRVCAEILVDWALDSTSPCISISKKNRFAVELKTTYFPVSILLSEARAPLPYLSCRLLSS